MLRQVFKKALTLATGVIGGQIFVIAASPILTRVYSPADFGAFGVYAALLYLFLSAASLRYEVAIPLVSRGDDAIRLAIAAFAILFLSAIFCSIVVSIAGLYYFTVHRELFVWLLPLGIILAGTYNITVNYALRNDQHLLIAKTGIVRSASGALIQVFAGFAGVGLIGLIIGQMIGLSSGLYRMACGFDKDRLQRCLGIKKIFVILQREKNFAKFDAPAALISVANTHAPTVIVGFLFSPVAAGVFSLVQRVIATPLGVFSAAISSSVLSQGRKIKNQQHREYEKDISSLIRAVPPIAAISAALLYWMFGFVFGGAWQGGAVVAVWVVLFLGYKLIFDSMGSIFLIQGKQRQGAQIQAIVLVTRIVCLIFFAKYFGFDKAIFYFSIVSSIAYMMSSYLIFTNKISDYIIRIGTSAFDLVASYFVVWLLISADGSHLAFMYVLPTCFLWAAFRIYPIFRIAIKDNK